MTTQRVLNIDTYRNDPLTVQSQALKKQLAMFREVRNGQNYLGNGLLPTTTTVRPRKDNLDVTSKIPTTKSKTSMAPLTLKRPTNESPEVPRKHESTENMSLPPPSFRISDRETLRHQESKGLGIVKEMRRQSAKKQTSELRQRLQRCTDLRIDDSVDNINDSRDMNDGVGYQFIGAGD